MRRYQMIFLVGLAVSLISCVDLYLMEDIQVQKDGVWESAGGGCAAVENNVTTSYGLVSAAGEPTFKVVTTFGRSSAKVEVLSGTEPLEERKYDEKFLESGKEDVFQVTSLNQDIYRFRYWGGDTCEDVHPEE